jgi:probable F420-dependent oxidoreductase
VEIGIVGCTWLGEVDWPDFARRAEDAGLESVFLPEHSHWPGRRAPADRKDPGYAAVPDPFIALSAMAAVTSRLRVGTGVCIVPQHDPINLAKTVATLDVISRGRFLFGVGVGWIDGELRDHGVDPRTRFAQTWEYVDLMRRLWTGELIVHEGRFLRLPEIQQPLVPVQRPGPPVLAGIGPQRLADVVDHTDGWFPHASEFTAEHVSTLQALAASKGRVMPPITLFNAPADERALATYRELGVARVLLQSRADSIESWRDEIAGFGRFVA